MRAIWTWRIESLKARARKHQEAAQAHFEQLKYTRGSKRLVRYERTMDKLCWMDPDFPKSGEYHNYLGIETEVLYYYKGGKV